MDRMRSDEEASNVRGNVPEVGYSPVDEDETAKHEDIKWMVLVLCLSGSSEALVLNSFSFLRLFDLTDEDVTPGLCRIDTHKA